MKKIEAPWTPVQVAALNAHQQRSEFHPYTCGGDRTDAAHVRYATEVGPHHDSGILIAQRNGWICPVCFYRQTWAHDPFPSEPWACTLDLDRIEAAARAAFPGVWRQMKLEPHRVETTQAAGENDLSGYMLITVGEEPEDAINPDAATFARHIEASSPEIVVELITRLRTEQLALGNLLAVIHGDGGHYQVEHGTVKAAADAQIRVRQDRQPEIERRAAIEEKRRRLTSEQNRPRTIYGHARGPGYYADLISVEGKRLHVTIAGQLDAETVQLIRDGIDGWLVDYGTV